MASPRTRRTVAGALLLLVLLATTGTAATAKATTPDHQQRRYCKRVDAYRIKSCASPERGGACAGDGRASVFATGKV
jgi:hypothetical protein